MIGDLREGGKFRGSEIFPARLLTAIVQAVALYLLSEAATVPPSWPATVRALYDPLFLVSIYIPLIAHFGLGQVGARPFTIWASVATIVVAGLGYHDATRGTFVPPGIMTELVPRIRLLLALSGALFVAHVLVVDSVIEKHLVPPYPRHFDTAWKLGVQIALTILFVLVFWGVLYLGAGLFRLVDIDFFLRLIRHRWFAYPATTLAVAVAIHTTDVQPGLIRGARSLALTLLSWLLPLLVLIVLGFLASLPFISLASLWKTRIATRLLLVAAGLVVLLVNCCYQDGAAEQTRSRIKRVAASIGALELIPLVVLAAWALALRVGQYGWTVERILAAAVIVLAASYAVGYATSVIRASAWLKRIEITNFVTAYLFLAVVLALFSPIADPSRLMVSDQLARLRSGSVSPDRLDFQALKFDGAHWGAAALEELSQAKDGPDAATISAMAKRAQVAVNYWDTRQAMTAAEVADRIEVFPAGRALPAYFYDKVSGPWSNGGLQPFCLAPAARKCLARFVTLRPDDPEAILFLDNLSGSIFEQDLNGKWRKTAILIGTSNCAALRKNIEDGTIDLQPHQMPDLVAGGQRLTISPLEQYSCPSAPTSNP